MYHYVYLTTIKTEQRVLYYVGKHSTKNLNDGYVGSGVVIKHICRKAKEHPERYNIQCSHSKYLSSSSLAFELEELAISEARDKYSDNLINIADGGDCVLINGHGPMYGKRGASNPNFGRKSSIEHRKRISTALKLVPFEVRSKASKKAWNNHPDVRKRQIELAHSKEANEKRRNSLRKTLSTPEAKARRSEIAKVTQRKGYPWNSYDELYELWLKNGKPKRGRFQTIAKSNGFPEGNMAGIVRDFNNLC